jgi:hypothetical protein
MLGLGSSIVSGSVGGLVLIDTYNSDFTGGGGDTSSTWSDYSVEGGSITFATNQTIKSTGDWLKATFPNAAQTAASAMQGTLDGRTWMPGDVLEWSFKFYLDGDWEGTDDVFIRVQIPNTLPNQSTCKIISVTPDSGTEASNTTFGGGFLFQQDVDEVVVVTGRTDIGEEDVSSIRIGPFSTDDEPQDNTAYMAIKDLEIRTYRKFG